MRQDGQDEVLGVDFFLHLLCHEFVFVFRGQECDSGNNIL